MPKRATTLPLALPPRPRGAGVARWLYASLRDLILDGRLRGGVRLPATRDLARQYGLSRGTVVAAFADLAAEGYVTSGVGAGTFVNASLPEDLLHARRPASPVGRHVAAPRPTARSGFASRLQVLPGTDTSPMRAFRANQPAVDQFPTALWAQLASRRLRRVSASQLLGCPPAGYPPLQRALADYLRTSRGVHCDPEQVVIVSGVQEALDLVARVCIEPRDAVVVEDPGYTGASRLFTAHGARVIPGAVDAEGVVVDRARWRAARLAYVTPAHQYPLGVPMSLPRRLALLEWAQASGAWVFEDDYDSEFRYAGRPLPALQGMDRNGRVLFAGSLCKVLYPSLRLGYLVVPHALLDTIAAAKSLLSRHAPVLEQSVVCDFLAAGHFARYIRRMREVYAERWAAMVTAFETDLAGRVDVSPIEAGLQTVGWLGRGLAEAAVARAAAGAGVEVVPLGRFHVGAPTRAGLLLGFAAMDVREIRRGAKALAEALAPLASGRGRVASPRGPRGSGRGDRARS